MVSGPAAAAALNRRRSQNSSPAGQAPGAPRQPGQNQQQNRQSGPNQQQNPGARGNQAGNQAAARGSAAPGPLPEDWQQEPPEDPYAGGPESNAWEQAEPPTDVYSAGHLSDTEWAATNWAGTGSSPATQGTQNRGNPAAGSPVQAAAGTGASSRPAQAPHAQPQAQAASSASSVQTAPSPAAGRNDGRPLSRYQKLLNEAAQRGGSANPSAVRSNVNLVEDIPSADDITLEDSGLVGRKAIERILGGRLIEERGVDGR